MVPNAYAFIFTQKSAAVWWAKHSWASAPRLWWTVCQFL